jgi:hypothetical protein
MKTTQTLRSLVLAQALALAAAFGAQAAPEDYTFTLTSSDLRPGDGVDIAVSLTDLRTNTPVSGAVIFTTRLDMAPDGMEAMTTSIEVMPEGEPGIYHFKADLMMGGNWRLQIAAKVQGEAETVQGEMILSVQP